MHTAVIAGVVLAAQYIGIFDAAVKAVIDVHTAINWVLPARVAPIPPVHYVVVPKKVKP